MSLYEYKAMVLRVIDGDSIILDVALGLHVYTQSRFRLLGINTPEIRAVGTAGEEAKAELERLLPVGSTVIIRTEKDKTERWGRWLCRIQTSAGIDVCQALIDGGFAKSWDGHGPPP